MDTNYPLEAEIFEGKNPRKKLPTSKAMQMVKAYHESENTAKFLQNTEKKIISDPLGSYTGFSFDNSKPIQDADDL